MNFVVELSKTPSKHDTIWVIVDRLIKSAHFIPIRGDYSLNKLARLYVNKIIRLHGVTISVVSDRDPTSPRISSEACKELWVQIYILVRPFIRKLMDSQNKPYKL